MDLLLNQDEISWKAILYDLVKTEQMNPWDVDISLLTQKFIQVIKEMQEHEFKISGKVLLAAAVLLKIKATYLIDNDISKLDQLINQTNELDEDEIIDEMESRQKKDKQGYHLIPRNPQPRNRKVSIHDLVEALQQAMISKRKILAKQKPTKFPYNFDRKFDIMEVIKDLYHKITYYTRKDKKDTLTFTMLLPPNAGKYEKAHTFLPLLHLEHQQKVETEQRKPFDEIYIKLAKEKAAEQN